MPGLRVIVTRPAHDAVQWIDQLQQSGFDAASLPLIEIAAASDPGDALALQTAWQSLHQYAACMFVSGNAAQYFFKQNRPLPPINSSQEAPDLIASTYLAKVPESLRFLAPGPGTAAALRAFGIPAVQIDSPAANAAQFDSSALWDVIGSRDWRGARVLMVRGRSQSGGGPAVHAGDQPRDWLTQQLQGAGANVDTLYVYERRVPTLNASQTSLAFSASADGSVWLFSSSEAVTNLRSAKGLTDLDWRAAAAVATHPRIVQAVHDAGFGAVLASRPALSELVEALRSIESKRHES